jgi:hypothetical protein
MKCPECDREKPVPAGDLFQFILFTFLIAWIFEIAANHLGPKYFHFPEITYWDSFAAFFMVRALLGIKR